MYVHSILWHACPRGVRFLSDGTPILSPCGIVNGGLAKLCWEWLLDNRFASLFYRLPSGSQSLVVVVV